MCKYKHSPTKIETSYTVSLLNGTNCRFVDYKYDTILLSLSSFGQFFLSDPKGS